MRMSIVLPMVFFMFFLVVLVLVFKNTVNYVGTSMGSSGWSTVRPMTQTAVYDSDGDLTVSFNSLVENSITISEVNVTDVSGDYSCAVQPDITDVSVDAFGTFGLKAKCPPKTSGDVYSIYITITYMPYNGFASDEVTEEGRVFGHTV
jgi:hypothetical protein